MNKGVDARGQTAEMSAKSASGWLRNHSSRIIAFGVLLAILYLGRSVLIPLTLAIMLSFLISPFIRALERVRVGKIPAVFIAVAALTLSCLGVAVALGTQVLHIVESLPQYESNVQLKIKALENATAGPIRWLKHESRELTESRPVKDEAYPNPLDDVEHPQIQTAGVSLLAPSELESSPGRFAWKLLTAAWYPTQFAGIVLLVLIFMLLEHESLANRFIRMAGARDARSTRLALNEAGKLLSRYFVSQAAVNLGFGLAIWISFSLLHMPQALLCGALAGLTRFIPYVGVAIGALFAAVLALAASSGFSLALCTLGVFTVLDVVVGQLLEPHLYGRATGLSPLAVLVGAIFWSSLWGPLGLLLSTPLSLCLLVAGRHIKGLGILELLLGSSRPFTLPRERYAKLQCEAGQAIQTLSHYTPSHRQP
jgi:predicted PurR-regulated permease PerM